MLSAVLMPAANASLTTSTPKSPTLSTTLIPTNCPAGTSQGDAFNCPEGNIKAGFTTKGVCCKRVYTNSPYVPPPVTRPPSVQIGPSQAPMGPGQVQVGPSQVATGPADTTNPDLLAPVFPPEAPAERKWLKPVLIGGGVLAALGITIAVIRR